MELNKIKEILLEVAETYKKLFENNDIENFDYDEFNIAIRESLNQHIYVNMSEEDYPPLYDELISDGYKPNGEFCKEANVEDMLEDMLISKIEELTGIEDIAAI